LTAVLPYLSQTIVYCIYLLNLAPGSLPPPKTFFVLFEHRACKLKYLGLCWSGMKTKTYKYRLYPTRKQTRALEHTLEVCRVLYNSALLDRKNSYEKTGKGLGYCKQASILKANKGKVEVLHAVHSQVLQNVLKRVDRSFQNFFRRVKEGKGKVGYPRFKSEGRYDSLTYPQEPGFQITPQGLRLSKIGTLKLKLHRTIEGRVKTCTVRRDLNRWYACFSVEYEPVKKAVPAKEVGIDMGLKSFAVLSDGTTVANPKYLRKSEKRLKRKQRELSRKKKGSTNRRKSRVVVARLHRKVREQRSDFHHKVSRKLVNTCGFIAVEDLNIKGMVKNHRLAKSISDAGWGQFLNYLAYKAEEAGCRVEKVPPHYTSVICSVCGERVPKTLSDRVHDCPFCGVSLDRDHNAAINILNRAGTARINAWGETALQGFSPNQEASPVRAR